MQLTANISLLFVFFARVKAQGVLPNRFIIELERSASNDVPLSHQGLYSALRQHDVDFEVGQEFNSDGLFVGAAITLDRAKDVAVLSGIKGIRAVRPVRVYKQPQPVRMETVLNSTVIPDTEAPHIMTGVDKLHAEGFTGSGIKIGIIDTGIDYTHPALGGGFGAGSKVIGGYDFVGDNFTGSNTPVPDPDPLDQCNGHGTHVAGIIGADPNNPYNISGVSYSASLSAYRVFGCSGVTTDDIIVAALLRGVQDDQDILTMSIGGSYGWTEGTANVVASRISDTGRIVTIAAGNDGPSGSWYTSSPGNAIDSMSVASVDNVVIYLNNATVQGVVHDPITYYSIAVIPVPGPLPIYATSNDTTIVDDACNPLPDSTPDLAHYAVITRRGTCTFVQKLGNLAAKGAQVVLIYDNGTGFGFISAGNSTTVSLIQAADGEFLVQEFAAGESVTLSFPQDNPGSVQFPYATGGLVSTFSSYGPTNDLYLKPSLAAPGGNILSTLPTTRGLYGMASGTSMACPFVAGSAALLLSAKGKSSLTARTARDLLETTAQAVPATNSSTEPLQTAAQQGAGLVNVYNAMHTPTIVSPGVLLLNDSAQFNGSQSFTVQNMGNSSRDYVLTHLPAGTATTIQPGTILPENGPVPLTDAHASINLTPSTFSLSPGQQQTILAQFSPPMNANEATLPVYSGYIQITGDLEGADGQNSTADVTHVTYMGLKGSLINQRVLDNTSAVLGIPLPSIFRNGNISEIQTQAMNYSFSGEDYPAIIYRLAFGTTLLQIDLVESGFNVPEQRNSGTHSFGHQLAPGSLLKVPVGVGVLAEELYLPRNDNLSSIFYTFNMPTPTFANGLYKVLVRALRVTGDPANMDDYDLYLSPTIGYNAS